MGQAQTTNWKVGVPKNIYRFEWGIEFELLVVVFVLSTWKDRLKQTRTVKSTLGCLCLIVLSSSWRHWRIGEECTLLPDIVWKISDHGLQDIHFPPRCSLHCFCAPLPRKSTGWNRMKKSSLQRCLAGPLQARCCEQHISSSKNDLREKNRKMETFLWKAISICSCTVDGTHSKAIKETLLSVSRRLHEHQIKFLTPKRCLCQEKGIMLSRASRDTGCADIQWYLLPCATLPGAKQELPNPIFADDVSDTQFFFFFFAMIDLVAARESIVLLRNTAGLSMSMESCWQMYSGNFKENMSAPLKEAGQRGENVTRETRSKWEILPSLPIVLQQTLCSVRWKIICSSNKHHRAADMGASPTGRKAVVTLEYILDASIWAGAAVLQTALHHWGLSGHPQGSALLRLFSPLAAWPHESLLGGFGGRWISHLFHNSNSQQTRCLQTPLTEGPADRQKAHTLVSANPLNISVKSTPVGKTLPVSNSAVVSGGSEPALLKVTGAPQHPHHAILLLLPLLNLG